MDMEVQTRDADGHIIQHQSLRDAFHYASLNEKVWKISFESATGEHVRLTYDEHAKAWVYDSMEQVIDAAIRKATQQA